MLFKSVHNCWSFPFHSDGFIPTASVIQTNCLVSRLFFEIYLIIKFNIIDSSFL